LKNTLLYLFLPLLPLALTGCSADGLFAQDLHRAALAGNMSRIKSYVEAGGKVDTVGDGGPLIRYAALGGHVELMRYLLAHGADEKERSFGKALIHDATESKNVDAVKFLLARVARDIDVNCPTTRDSILGEQGVTPLLIAAQNLDYDMAAYLISQGANVNAKDEYLNTPLIEAVFLSVEVPLQHERYKLTKLLVEHGADVNAPDKKGSSPVALAALTDDREIVKYLVQKGAATNKKGEDDETAFTYAAWNGNKESVEYFVQLGANPAARLSDGSMAAMRALRSDKVDFLPWFISHYHYNILATDTSGQNLLLQAIRVSKLATIQFLVNELKMDVNCRDARAITPLQLASSQLDVDKIRFLLEKGAQINAQDQDGYTPLIRVAQAAYIGDSTPSNEEACQEAIHFLLAHGARTDIRSKEGFTALDYVKDKPFPNLQKLLK
jgi:ankyrin repeat protein